MNIKYRIFGSKCRKVIKLEPCDLVWVHLRKDMFIDLRKSKLVPHVVGLFKVLKSINNAYKLELLKILGLVPPLIF
jgi:hypothetical protein